MKNNKELYWKIGTNIQSYISHYLKKFSEIDKINKNKKSIVFKIVNETKSSASILFEEFSDYNEINLNKATLRQKIMVLIILNIIKPKIFDQENWLLSTKEDKFINENIFYEVNNKNWKKDFIENIKKIDNYLEENKELDFKSLLLESDLENYLLDQVFYSRNHIRGIYNILSSFYINSIKDGNYEKDNYLDEKKFFAYWKVDELMNEKWSQKNILLKYCYKFLGYTDNNLINIEQINFVNWDSESIKKQRNEISKIDISEKKFVNIFAIHDLLEFLNKLNYKIKIPIMQRKYSWTKELIKNFFESIIKVSELETHSIGTIIYNVDKNNGKIKIIDGQQRIFSLLIILASLFFHYRKNNLNVPKIYKKLFVDYNSNSFLLKNKFEIIPGNNDYNEFLSLLDVRKNIDPNKSESNQTQFFINWKFLINYLNNLLEGKNVKIINEQLDKFTNNVLLNISFIFYHNYYQDEFEIFKNVNTITKPLSKLELLKNSIFSKLEKEVLDNNEELIQKEFHLKIYEKFKKENSKKEVSFDHAMLEKFSNYLISMFLIKNKNPNKKIDLIELVNEIYIKKFNSKYITRNNYEKLLTNISNEIDWFLATTNKKIYFKTSSSLYPFADILSSFEKRYVYTPLIIMILKKEKWNLLSDFSGSYNKNEILKINKIRKILFELERYEILFQINSNKGDSLTNIINKIASNIYQEYYSNSKKELNPKDLRKKFGSIEFMSSFNLVVGTNSTEEIIEKINSENLKEKISNILLKRIEWFLRLKIYERNNIEDIIVWKDQPNLSQIELIDPSVEHILSQTANDKQQIIFDILKKDKIVFDNENHKSIFEDMKTKHLNKLGNILMINKNKNSEIKNKPFSDKLKFYNTCDIVRDSLMFLGIKNDISINFLNNKKIKLKGIKIIKEKYSFNDINNRTRELSEILKIIYH